IDELAERHAKFSELNSPTADDVAAYEKDIADLSNQVRDHGAAVAKLYDSVPRFTRGGEGGQGRRIPVIHVRRRIIDQVLTASLGKTLSELEREIDVGPTPRSSELSGWKAVGRTSIDRVDTDAKNVVA